MKRLPYILLFPLAAAAALFLQCSGTGIAGGGTIETTNGVAGVIRNGDTTPASNTVVKLFPDDYDPVADSADNRSAVDTTDADGLYRFSRVAAGRYVVIARNRTAATVFLARGVTVNDDSLTTVPAGTLDRPGSIVAELSLDNVPPGGYVYIPGTDLSSPVGKNGSAVLTDVPPGTITAVILASGENEQHNILRNDITVAAGDTAIIDHPFWNYNRRIVLNTTPAGAGVTVDVYNFPVLVRLNRGNFDFSQARSDGGDLIVTGDGNAALPFEIERWDASAGRAEVWVKVDTIHGNDSVQSITMYWGNPDASPRSAGGTVFDTATGFQGVWHLGGSANDSVRDATVNRFHGTSPDSARPPVVEGVIGNCRLFDGVADYISMPNTADSKLNFPVEGFYTISVWVALDTFDNAPHLIVAKGYDQYFMRFTYFPSNTPLWEFVELDKSASWQACTTTVQSRQWTLLTGVRNGRSQLLYCNGVLVDSVPNSYTAAGHVWNSSNDLIIGKFMTAVNLAGSDDSFCFFRGSIDEARIISRAQTPDWIRLCYMNQRVDDRLVVFR